MRNVMLTLTKQGAHTFWERKWNDDDDDEAIDKRKLAEGAEMNK